MDVKTLLAWTSPLLWGLVLGTQPEPGPGLRDIADPGVWPNVLGWPHFLSPLQQTPWPRLPHTSNPPICCPFPCWNPISFHETLWLGRPKLGHSEVSACWSAAKSLGLPV